MEIFNRLSGGDSAGGAVDGLRLEESSARRGAAASFDQGLIAPVRALLRQGERPSCRLSARVRPAICIAGRTEIAVFALEEVCRRGLAARTVVCPGRSDMGQAGWQPSLVRAARALGVRIVTLDEAEAMPGLLFLSLEFDRIVRPERFAGARLYNVHFSKLPAYKGMYTAAWPILDGAVETGVTLHEIDHGIDTGPIVASRTFAIEPAMTARDIYFRCQAEARRLFAGWIDRLLGGTPEAVPQPAAGSTYRSKRSLDYATLALDLRVTGAGLLRQVRAFSFREFQVPVLDGMEIGDGEVLDRRSRAAPGTVLYRDAECLIVATVDYDVRLTRHRAWDWFDLGARDPATLDRLYIDVRNVRGWTPLIVAAFAGDLGRCRVLLDHGADPMRGNCHGTTPVMYARSGTDAAKGRAVARLLAEREANRRIASPMI